MTSVARIQELLDTLQRNGEWTKAELAEIEELTMPDYPEENDLKRVTFEMEGEPVSYDKERRIRLDELPPGHPLEVRWDSKPRPPLHTHELPLTSEERRGPIVAMGITEEERQALMTMGPGGEVRPTYPNDERIKTLEATVTDLMRRLKALEERVLDPSV